MPREGVERGTRDKNEGTVQPAVFGATGYSGFELVRLLARHSGSKKPMLFAAMAKVAALPT